MKVYDQRSDNLIYIGYWTISTAKGLYEALFADPGKVNSLVMIPMTETGDLYETLKTPAKLKQIGSDLRVCYESIYRKILIDDTYSLGGSGAAFNTFTLVNSVSFRWTDSDIIHFGKREQIKAYSSKEAII